MSIEGTLRNALIAINDADDQFATVAAADRTFDFGCEAQTVRDAIQRMIAMISAPSFDADDAARIRAEAAERDPQGGGILDRELLPQWLTHPTNPWTEEQMAQSRANAARRPIQRGDR